MRRRILDKALIPSCIGNLPSETLFRVVNSSLVHKLECGGSDRVTHGTTATHSDRQGTNATSHNFLNNSFELWPPDVNLDKPTEARPSIPTSCTSGLGNIDIDLEHQATKRHPQNLFKPIGDPMDMVTLPNNPDQFHLLGSHSSIIISVQ